jgi:DNA mismatch repair protein MutS
MVEMEETATILHHATRHSLIILDEIGRGTSTYDGLAIARAVVEHLHHETGARTLFATHYHELASMADELPHLGVCTMAISEDEQGNIVFLHRVTAGCIGRSYGVHVAKLAGMPASVVRRAEAVLQHLESGKSKTHDVFAHLIDELATNQDHNGRDKSVSTVYNGHGRYDKAISALAEMHGRYEWQSEEAHQVAALLERAEDAEPDLETIDLSSITPLDALNLLFLLQKKRKRSRQ